MAKVILFYLEASCLPLWSTNLPHPLNFSYTQCCPYKHLAPSSNSRPTKDPPNMASLSKRTTTYCFYFHVVLFVLGWQW